MSRHSAFETRSDQTHGWTFAVYVVVILVLPQFPFWLAGTGFSLDRPVFNLDVMLAALIACRFKRIGLTLLVLAWSADIARIASLNYHFDSPLEFAETAQFAGLVALRQVMSWKLLLGLIGLGVCLAGLGRLVSRRSAPAMFIAMMLVALLDMFNGSSQLLGLGADRFRVGANISGSPTWNIIHAGRHAVALSHGTMTRFPHPRVVEAVTDWHRTHPAGNVLLIVVESMGRPAASEIEDWLARRLVTPALNARWTLNRAIDEFHGPTTSGELRVLCGIKGSYTDIRPSDEADCLPMRWKAEGLDAYGLHGFHLRMFDRDRWWPRIGLSPWNFEPLRAAGPQFGCNGAFPGVCDDMVLETAMRLVDQPSKFVYVLTLDTHLPLRPGRQVPSDLAELCEQTRTGDVACQMVAELGIVLEDIAARLSRVGRPPLAIIVGDHSPPFLASESRGAFDGGTVPLYTLTPREKAAGQGADR